jgi:hypothetical protein
MKKSNIGNKRVSYSSYVNDSGYRVVRIIVNGRSTWVLEHRYIMENSLSRPLLRTEQIHHIDNNKLNNNISNLVIVTALEHSKLHGWVNGWRK